MIKLIQQRLDHYGALNAVMEEQAAKEITQEIALYALWRADFFEVAAFQGGHINQKLRIKLEIDVAPPKGSEFDYTYLDFPSDYEVCHQDLSSNFALKIHALLCRGFIKGRDWYDFNWYVKQQISPNLLHLQNALIQFGPWANDKDLVVDLIWLKETLKDKITTINWRDAADDVEKFLSTTEQPSLRLWSDRFFSSKVDRLAAI